MSKAFDLGIKVGSFVRRFFMNEQSIRVEPVLLPEKQVSELELLRQDQVADLKIDRTHTEGEIKTVIKYQEVFLDRLITAYIKHHPEDSVEEMPQDIVNIFQSMSRNNKYLDEMINKLEEIDLKECESTGFTEVTAILNKIKKDSK